MLLRGRALVKTNNCCDVISRSGYVAEARNVQHFDRRALDDFVFQRRNSERPLPSVGLGDVHPTHWLRSVRSSLQPMGEILEIVLEGLAVVPPRLSIDTGRNFLLQTEVGRAQRFQVIQVEHTWKNRQDLSGSPASTTALRTRARTGCSFLS